MNELLPGMQIETIAQLVDWLNANSGVTSVSMFVIAGLFGWFSGLFDRLRQRPRFHLDVIPGPTFLSIFATGEQKNGYPIHRIGIAIYLRITNAGTAPSSIQDIHIGYRWNIAPITWDFLRFGVFRFWLREPHICLDEFQHEIGESLKIYPFLTQANSNGQSNNGYLNIGQSTSGVIYFEQPDSWGGCQPRISRDNARITVRALDSFGGKHTKSFPIPVKSLSDARKYNPRFGQTWATLSGTPLPEDAQERSDPESKD